MVKNLQELDKAKSNLYTNITHEFRTPITVILGITDILNDQLNDEQKEDLAIISRNGEKLLNLVNQMLDLAKLDSGSIVLNKINGNFIESVNYIIASFESISKQKNTRVHKLYDTPEIFMDFDPEKMESVLTNLLDNALKNTKNGDIYVIISHEKESNNLMIKIKDTGSGIPAEFANKIFDRFFQVEKSESGLTGGTGIGLAIVKEYVQFMGGEIKVKSEISKGTEFTIQIPVTNELTPEEIPHRMKITGHQIATEKSIGTKTKKDLPVLLIIEDNDDLVQFLIKLLNDEFEIVVAKNGKEGIDKALEHIPDIIISDVMMPEMNGFEVTDRLKSDLRTSHIPVLLLTAKADEKSKISGLSKGADAYMIKPFSKKELKIRLEKLIELRKKLKSRYEYYIPELIPSGKGTSLNETFLKKIKEDLEKNYSDENYNTEQLCRNIGVSRVQLFRKLKALTGNAPSLMIRSYRLEKAKNLIISTDRQIAEIAYNCGFGNATYFSQIFTEIYGHSPTQMRNMD
jgi:DNA-binding response OmpR family regulator/two-component sensor histidine kinase